MTAYNQVKDTDGRYRGAPAKRWDFVPGKSVAEVYRPGGNLLSFAKQIERTVKA